MAPSASAMAVTVSTTSGISWVCSLAHAVSGSREGELSTSPHIAPPVISPTSVVVHTSV